MEPMNCFANCPAPNTQSHVTRPSIPSQTSTRKLHARPVPALIPSRIHSQQHTTLDTTNQHGASSGSVLFASVHRAISSAASASWSGRYRREEAVETFGAQRPELLLIAHADNRCDLLRAAEAQKKARGEWKEGERWGGGQVESEERTGR
eukprot:1786391-Rhodomonas_salina.1